MQYYIEFTSTIIPFFIWFYLIFLCKQKLQINSLFWRSNIIIEKKKKLNFRLTEKIIQCVL